MVTSRHEASHRIFQDRPELLAPVFEIFGVPLPDKPVIEVLSPDATEIRPLERRVDSVLRIEPPDDTGGFLLAIEAQGRKAADKPVSWSYYLSYLKAKYQVPALLLVVCQDLATAKWAHGPFKLGTDGWTALSVHPLVLGPGNMPVITDVARAERNLAFATLAAMTHGRHESTPAILKTLAQALGRADAETAEYFVEMLEIALEDTEARQIWRSEMKVNGSFFPGRGTLIEETFLEGKAEGKAEGRAEGRAQAILVVLERRGVPTLAATRDRITTCTDLDTLDRWLDRAFSVTGAEELFETEGAGDAS